MAMPATASTITPANSSGILKASADWLISPTEAGPRAEQFGHYDTN